MTSSVDQILVLTLLTSMSIKIWLKPRCWIKLVFTGTRVYLYKDLYNHRKVFQSVTLT